MPRRHPPRETATLTTTQVARILGYAPRTIRRHRDLLGGYRLGREWRYPAALVVALIAHDVEAEATS